MVIFLLGLIIGIIVGPFILCYSIVVLLDEDPDKFDQLITEVREKLKQKKN